MRKIALLVPRVLFSLLAALVLASPALAGVVDCDALTATQRRQAETIGACAAGAPKSVCTPATDAGLAAFIELLASAANYQPTVPCAAERIVVDRLLTHAGPGDGDCTVERIGEEVANPQPVEAVALRELRRQWNERIVNAEATEAAEAERERVRAAAAAALVEADAAP